MVAITANKSAKGAAGIASAIALSGLKDAKVQYVTGGQDAKVEEKPEIKDAFSAIQYIASLAPAVYGSDAALAQRWIAFAASDVRSSDFAKAGASLDVINTHLKMRTLIAGYTVTLADIVVFESLKSSQVWAKNLKTKGIEAKYPHLVRWYTYVDSLPLVKNAYKEIQAAAASSSSDKLAKKDQASYDIDLPDAAKGKVVTRFPPEPSGYLHIGHAKAALLNEYFARHYEGKLVVRFDDTNPSKEKEEFEDAIIYDLALLKIKPDIVTHTSDYFDRLEELCIQMIKEGNAYVDDTQQEQMRKERMDGIASKCRDQSVEENLRRFNEMKNGTEFGLTCCVRSKMSVDSKNKALRDPVMYRCNLTPHARTGTKYKVYPTYDFACPVVDSIEGVTHALRTNEYHDRNDQYWWFQNALKLRKVHIWDYSRMNFIYTLLSKRKLTWFVDKKYVDGWDDPRFPTIRGILRRGMTVEALKEYILMQGPSRNILLLEWDKLWAVNKKIIDPVAPRYTSIIKKDMVTVTLSNGPAAPEVTELARHKKNPAIGNKKVTFSSKILLEAADAAAIEQDEEVTLMDWGNCFMRKIHRDASGKVTAIDGELHLEGDFKKTKKKLTWLSADAKHIKAVLHDYDFLITKKKIEEEEDFEDFINPKTSFEAEAIVDADILAVNVGDIIQLERKAFFRCDAKNDSQIVLIEVPDGKPKNPLAEGNKPAAAEKKPAEAKSAKKAAPAPAASSSSSAAPSFGTVSSMYRIKPYDASGFALDVSSIKMYRIRPMDVPSSN